MGVEGWRVWGVWVFGGGYWLCVHTCPISTQSVWQASVAITTPPRVAFLSHQPVSSLLSVGAFLSHSTEGQQTASMYTVADDIQRKTVQTHEWQVFHWYSAEIPNGVRIQTSDWYCGRQRFAEDENNPLSFTVVNMKQTSINMKWDVGANLTTAHKNSHISVLSRDVVRCHQESVPVSSVTDGQSSQWMSLIFTLSSVEIKVWKCRYLIQCCFIGKSSGALLWKSSIKPFVAPEEAACNLVNCGYIALWVM